MSQFSPAVKADIDELKNKIDLFRQGKYDEERFRHYRLTRGVYGQRQFGVHMFRTKLPYGRIAADQLRQLARISEKWATGNLHLTTRQNVQFHYVKLSDATAIWEAMAEKNLTAREACGNTVRNVTACPYAGINKEEPFDVTPYAHATFEYFLRNPICQDMGRKVKIAFSSSEADSAFTYFHDFGFIPKVKKVDGQEQRGFTVKIGGGLGAVAIEAPIAYDFLPVDKIIPFMEAGIRVFDRLGERAKRMKARMKFLVKSLGMEAFMELVEAEMKAVANKSVPIDGNTTEPILPTAQTPIVHAHDQRAFEQWVSSNVKEQKQEGYLSIALNVPLGDVSSEIAIRLADLVEEHLADDIRISVNQGLVLRFARKEQLPFLFNELSKLGLGLSGFDRMVDVTACPGTDTCNLGVSNSTSLAMAISEHLRAHHPDLVHDEDLKIKISGCMNACGQHMAASIGFHGSSIKAGNAIIPAVQIVLGGGIGPDNVPYIADKIIKIPSKRALEALDILVDDLQANQVEHCRYNAYVKEKGRKYFYGLLKELGSTTEVDSDYYFDWGQDKTYVRAIGVGECAGVSYDLVSTIIGDAREHLEKADIYAGDDNWSAVIYSAYSSQVIAAKALLLSIEHECNTHLKIIKDFTKKHLELTTNDYSNFEEKVLAINQNEPSRTFANDYLEQAKQFFNEVVDIRKSQMGEEEDRLVMSNYYKA